MRPQIHWSALALHLITVLVLLAMACSGGGSPGQGQAKPESNKPKYGGELRLVLSAPLSYVDPQKSSGGSDPFMNWIYSAYLMEITESGELKPSVAESWSIPDPKTIVFKLRPGVKFHDGTDVDSAAIKFTIERGQDVKTNSPLRPQYLEITQVETPDPLTVIFHLPAPNSGLLYALRGGAGPIISPTAVKKWGNDFEQHVVSAGPFEIEKSAPDSEMVFKRFENYFGKDADGNKLPYLDRIRVTVLQDVTVATAALEAGDVDLNSNIESVSADRIKANSNLTLLELAGNSMIYVNLYTVKPPMDNLDVRKAIAYGIDREELAKSVYGGHAIPATTHLTPDMWAWDPKIEGYKYDPAKAREHLAKAGYPNGGIKIKFATFPSFKDMAEGIQAQLKRVGMDVSLDIMDMVTYQKAFRDDGRYDMGMGGSPYRVEPDLTLERFYGSNGFYNPGKPKIPEFDNLLLQGRSTYDLQERKKIYSQLQQAINDHVHNVFTIYYHKYMAYRSYVKGFTVGSDRLGDVRWIWLDK